VKTGRRAPLGYAQISRQFTKKHNSGMKKQKLQDSQDGEAETSQVNPEVHADEFSE